MNYVHKTIPSPVGRLKLIASKVGLVAILWDKDNPKRVPLNDSLENNKHPIFTETERQLKEYFEAKRNSFSIKLHPSGTEFQQIVWEALSAIPFGETRSYGELAMQIGRPSAARAVGAAIGKNPISIIVPCHRVIGASGRLTGFAGGLKIKAQLLDLEKHKLLEVPTIHSP